MRSRKVLLFSCSIFSLFIIPLFLILSPRVVQARWSLTPRIFVEQQYDDNLFLTEKDEQDDFATVLGPGISLEYESPTELVELDYQYRRFFYYDFTELDYDDHRGTLEARKDFTPWFSARVRQRFIRSEDPIEYTGAEEFDRESIRQEERRSYIRNLIEPEATFRFGERSALRLGYRNRILRNNADNEADQDENAGNALLTYRLNIHNELQLYYEHIDQDFDQTDPPQLPRDFKADVTRGRYTYFLSPKISTFAQYRYINKDLDQENPRFFDYEVHNPIVGFSQDLYKNLSLTVSGGYGVRKTDEKNDTDIFTGRLDFSGRYKRFNLTVYGERGFYDDYNSAESDGFYRFWRAGFNGRYQFLQRLWLDSFILFTEREFVDRDRTDKYYRASARLNYRILRWAYVSLDYQYNERDSNIPLRDYQRNRVFLRITFEYDVAEKYQ